MKTEDQIIAGIEELAIQLGEIKKEISGIQHQFEKSENPDDIKKLEGIIQNNFRLYSDQFKELSSNYSNLIKAESLKKNEITHSYIEITHWKKWIFGFLSFFVFNLICCGFLWERADHYQKKFQTAHDNDIKYRFLKVQNESLANYKKVADNTTDLVYYVDSYYKSNPNKVEGYVKKREEQIRLAIEAAEIAKQKEAEAKMAREKANNLTDELY